MRPLGPAEIAILIALVVLPVLGIVDASLLPSQAFRSAGHSKRFWILAQIILGYIAAVIYFAAIRLDVKFFSAPPSPDWEEEEEPSGADHQTDGTQEGH